MEELDNYSTFEVIDGNKFTIFSDKNCKVFAILKNWIYEKQFNIDFLNEFDEFIFNEKIITFITNYEFYEN